jgi:hypothetical protein
MRDMSEFLSFIAAVLSYWQAYLTGGIVTGAVGLFERLTRFRLTRRAYVTLFVGVFLFVSFFLAWRDQHKAVQEQANLVETLRQELGSVKKELDETKHTLAYEREQNTPKLIGTIDLFAVGDSPDINAAQVFVLLRVRNVGAPSIVEGYTLHVKSKDLDLQSRPFFIPENWTAHSNTLEVHFTRDMVFEDKAAKPIERGGRIAGWLRYVFEGMKAEHLHRIGTVYTLDFTDVLGNPYTATYTVDKEASDDQFFYNPGAGAPFKRKAEKKTGR